MGKRFQLNVFRERDQDRFRQAIESVLGEKGSWISWDEAPNRPAADCRTAHAAEVQSIYVADLGGFEHELLLGLGRELGGVWITLLVQEGAIWEYMLYHRDQCIDRFSVAPAYWDDSAEFAAKRRGNSTLLSEMWGVSLDLIPRCLVDWQMGETGEGVLEYGRRGKAYPGDRFGYRDFNQVFDFLRALGGSDPTNCLAGARQHALFLP